MTLLYRVGDELVIEAEPAVWETIECILTECLDNGGVAVHIEPGVTAFVNAIRAHLQHVETSVPIAPSDNFDLV